MRSKRTEKYAAFFEYMGVNARSLTDQQLEQIEEKEHTNDWLCRKLGVERGNKVFEEKMQRWWDGDRFILYPELYKTDIHFYLKRDLPELLATYVRGQFTGSSERITKKKIEEAVQTMLKENTTWWHDTDRKRLFLNRFAVMHPGCCDGKRPVSQSQTPPPSKTASVKAPQRNIPVSKRQSKKNSKDSRNFVVGVIVVVVILYFLFR